MANGNVTIKINGDSSNFEKSAKHSEALVKKLEIAGKQAYSTVKCAGELATKAIAAGATAAIGTLGGLAVKSIDLANDLTEAQNVVDVTFGKSADTINKWAVAAKEAYGLSELQAKQFNGTIGAMLKSMDISERDITKMSTDLIGLAGDMASFYNLDAETAFEKIRSGISGETEPLKQLGINLSETNLEAFALAEGMGTAYSEMSSAEKAMVRYKYMMSVTKDAQGDFSRTMDDSLANQLRVFQLTFTELSTSIGKTLMPTAQKYVSMLSGFGDDLKAAFGKDGIEGLISEGGQIVSKLIAELSAQAPKAIDLGFKLLDNIIDGLTDNLPKLSDAALKIISQLSDGIKNTMSKLKPTIGDVANVIVQGFFKYQDVFWSAGLDIVTAVAKGLADNAKTITQKASDLIGNISKKIIESLPIIIVSAARIATSIASAITENQESITSGVISFITTITETLIAHAPEFFEAAASILLSVLESLTESLPEFAENFAKMIAEVCKLLAENLPAIIEAASQFLEAFINELLGHADEIFSSVSTVISSLFDSFGKLTPKVQTLVTALATLYAAKGATKFVKTIKNIKDAITQSVGKAATTTSKCGAAIGLAAAAVGTFATIAAYSNQKWQEHLDGIRKKAAKLTDEQEKLKKKTDELVESYNDWKTSKDNALADATKEYDYYEALAGDLQTLVDHNGKIKEGQEEVVKGITEKLTAATGIKFEFKDGMIQHYDETLGKIEDVLTKQKALAMQAALGDSYAEAYTKKQETYSAYKNNEREYENLKKEKDISGKQKAYDEAKKEYDKWKGTEGMSNAAGQMAAAAKQKMDAAKAELDGARQALDDFRKKTLEPSEQAYVEYCATIENYNGLESAISSEDVNRISENLNKIENGFISVATGTKNTLVKQKEDAEKLYNGAIADFNAGVNGITKEQVKGYRNFVNRANAELAKFNLNEIVNEYKKVNEMTHGELLSHRDNASKMLSELQTLYDNGAEGITQQMVIDAGEMVDECDKKLNGFKNSADTNTYLLKLGLVGGIDGCKPEVKEAIGKVSDEIDKKLKEKDYKSAGEYVVQGFVEGIKTQMAKGDIFGAAASVAQMGVAALNGTLEINSPSRVTARTGKSFVDGFVGRIKKMSGSTAREIKHFAQGIVSDFGGGLNGAGGIKDTLNSSLAQASDNRYVLSPAVIASAQAGTRATANAATAQILTTSNVRNVTNNYNNQNGTRETVVEECKISFERGVNDLVDFLLPKIESAQRRRGKRMVNGVV